MSALLNSSHLALGILHISVWPRCFLPAWLLRVLPDKPVSLPGEAESRQGTCEIGGRQCRRRGVGWTRGSCAAGAAGCDGGQWLACTEAQVHGTLSFKVFVCASTSLTPGFPVKL